MGLLRKAAGLFVEMGPDQAEEQRSMPSDRDLLVKSPSTDALWAELEKAGQTEPAPRPAKTVEQIVKDAPGPNLDQINVASQEVAELIQPDGTVKFAAIYEAARLPAVPFTSEQIMEMFAGLPAELPIATRRQMIKVSINAMGRSIGATPENIVADASRKLAALSAYTDHLGATTNEYVGLSQQKIALLEAQIAETRKSIETAQSKLTKETELCTAEAHKLDEVLEFFSLDVAPSSYAPPAAT